MSSPLYAIAGFNGSDLFAAGTHKTTTTLKVNGRPRKVKSLIARAGMVITSGKYYDANGKEHSLTLTLLTTALEAGELVTFADPLHEIVTASAEAMFYFD